jgi:hypothetical protein
MSNHELIDQRSIAFGRAIAARIAADPDVITHARITLARWLTTCAPQVRPGLLEWQAALEGPVDGVVTLLTSPDERATRLRQSNPFAGVLSNQERNAIIRQFRANDTPAA